MGVFVCFWNSTLMTQKDQAIFCRKTSIKKQLRACVWHYCFFLCFTVAAPGPSNPGGVTKGGIICKIPDL
jgi:hypothetical protein